MHYVMSDIHGKYEKYLQMLELIQFSEQDKLFILGDIADRGEKPVEIYQDMMKRNNIIPIMGNHDYMALFLLDKLVTDMTEENFATGLELEDIQDILAWIDEGGDTTIAGFQKLSIPEREEILDYIAGFALYQEIQIQEKKFILVHAGLENFKETRDLDSYQPEEVLLIRDDPDKAYFQGKNIYVITGHTPTPYYSGKAEIYHGANRICIDCGACFQTGRLACLCLETMEEFYI
ncbi:MAG: fructose-bisphosphatase class III [Oscillospiraceae bacterium]|nr:fructose-bisphosphatase class III [Oscillospiraceae bacterium]